MVWAREADQDTVTKRADVSRMRNARLRQQARQGQRELIMFKKLALVGILGALGAGTVLGTGAWSYVKTGVHTAHQSVRDSVPIEWEIKRARDMICELKPEIQRNAEIVAREEVAVRRLNEEISSKETLLSKGRSDIMRLKGDLESANQSGSVHFTYAGRKYSENQVREDLSNRFKQFQVHEQTTEKLKQVLSARERNLDASRRKLEGMLAAKRELEVEIENIQARLTLVEVAQTNSPIALDDSRLSSTRQLLDEIGTRIDVAERMIASEGALQGAIELDETTSPELIDEISDYFGAGRSEVESLISAK
jgi:hypothetical protein